MSGITKDELMQMAEKAGIEVSGGEAWINQYHLTPELVEVVNAVLLRAAAECVRIQDCYWNGGGAAAATQCEHSILALKINTGDTND